MRLPRLAAGLVLGLPVAWLLLGVVPAQPAAATDYTIVVDVSSDLGSVLHVGTMATLTAVIECESPPGTPAYSTSGAVLFAVTGVNSTKSAVVRTDGSDFPTASWSYLGARVGHDTISAKLIDGGCDGTTVVGPGGAASIDWVGPPRLTLTQNHSTSHVHVPITVTATFIGWGSPVAGAAIHISAHMVGSVDMVTTGTTNGQGKTTFTYTRGSPGTDKISAYVVRAPYLATPITHRWTLPLVRVRVDPPNATSVVGATAVESVSVTEDGIPRSGAVVSVSITGAGVPDVLRTITTNSLGHGVLSYTRGEPTDDTITASVTVAGVPASDSAHRTWNQPPLALGVAPAGTSSRVGDPFTATATLRRGAQPQPGITVTFSATMTGQPTLLGSSATASDGTASFTFTRPVTGTDTIVGTVVVLPETVHASITHDWSLTTSTTPTPRFPEPSVAPGGDIPTAGSGCPPGAQVQFRVGTMPVGSSTADSAGAYGTVLHLPDLPIGRYAVIADCGAATGGAPIDIVSTVSTTGTAGSAATTTATVLMFFLLLGAQLVRIFR